MIPCRVPQRAKVVLASGTAMLPGFANRVHKELTVLASPAVAVRVAAPPGRGFSPCQWAGGSTGSLVARGTFWQMLVLWEEY